MIWYARIAVLAPLLVPACVWLLHVLGLADRGFLLGGLVGSLIVAGIPYAAFAIVGLAYLWDRPLAEYIRWSVRGPVLFIPVLAVFLMWSEFLGRVRSLMEFGDLLLLTVPLVLVVGYAYVGAFCIGVRALSGSDRSPANRKQTSDPLARLL